MKKRIYKYTVRLVILAAIIMLLMYESASDISYLYANF